ncbi:MAG: T9SS type A sorting domain-containing protein [Vicingaceae bacterium]
MKKHQHIHSHLMSFFKPWMVLTLFFICNNSNHVIAQNWNQIIKTVPSDRGAADEFGFSVAISGDYAIVGAYLEDEDTTGGNTLSSAGAAYILKNISGTWTEVQKLVPSDRGAADEFGFSVAISGNYAIVGAIGEDEDTTGGNTLSSAGSAYIFRNNLGSWTEVQKLVASDRNFDDGFGYSVAITRDYAIIGARSEDQDTLGRNTIAQAGSAYIFENNTGTWSELQKIVASDRGIFDFFGSSVAISNDYAIVGAIYEDQDTSGGNTLADAGSAYIFKNNSGTWSQAQKLVASDRSSADYFGWSVAISGDFVIVGAIGEDHDTSGANAISDAGSAYIFSFSSGAWHEEQKLVASDRGANDNFGNSVAISGETAIVGAPLEDQDTSGANLLTEAGSAYIFKKSLGAWSEVQKIVASDREANDYFGYAVAISGDYVIVGARLEDEDTTGSNTRNSAGSAYIFNKSLTVGIAESSFGELLKVYPNPTKGDFSIDLGNTYENTQVFITDITGRLVESKTLTQSRVLDLSIEAPAGIYLVSIQAGNKRAVIRLVKE